MVDSVECLFKVNENDAIQEAIADVNRPAICRFKHSCNGLCKEQNTDRQLIAVYYHSGNDKVGHRLVFKHFWDYWDNEDGAIITYVWFWAFFKDRY